MSNVMNTLYLRCVFLGVILVLAFAFVLVWVGAQPAEAGVGLDQENPLPDSGEPTGYIPLAHTRYDHVQTFTASMTGFVDSTSVYLKGQGGTEGFSIGYTIYAVGEDGQLRFLGSTPHVSYGTISGGGEWVNLDPPEGYEFGVEAGEKYALGVDIGCFEECPQPPTEIFWGSTGDTYSGGTHLTKDGNDPWIDQGEDLAFRTYVNDDRCPMLVGRAPAKGATGVGLGVNPTATFSEPLKPDTVNTTTVKLKRYKASTGYWTGVPVTVSMPSGTTVKMNPNNALPPRTDYRVLISGGLQDLWGNSSCPPRGWRFTTK